MGLYGAALLVVAGLAATLYFCQWCAVYLFTGDSFMSLGTGVDAVLARYVLFSAVTEALGFGITRCARLADAVRTEAFLQRGRLVSTVVSLEWTAAMLLSFFHAIFYRALFQRLEGWAQFSALAALHVGLTVVFYPVRMTRWYFKLSSRVQQRVRGVPLLRLAYDPSNPAQWNTRMSLDYMVRLVSAVGASLNFVVVSAVLHYGYNRRYFAFEGAAESDAAFRAVLLYLGVACIVELLCGVLVYVPSRRLVRGGVATPFVLLLWREPRYARFAVCGLAHVTTVLFLTNVQL